MRLETKKPYNFDRNLKGTAKDHRRKNRENLNISNVYGFRASNLVLFRELDFSPDKIHNACSYGQWDQPAKNGVTLDEI